jgi:hypothetical protein
MSRRPIVATVAAVALATLIAARGAPVPAKPPAIPVLVAETTSTGAFLDRDRLPSPPRRPTRSSSRSTTPRILRSGASGGTTPATCARTSAASATS